MFLLFVIYTDGSFLAPEIPAYFANISQIWVTFTFTLFTKTMYMALYYHLPIVSLTQMLSFLHISDLPYTRVSGKPITYALP